MMRDWLRSGAICLTCAVLGGIPAGLAAARYTTSAMDPLYVAGPDQGAADSDWVPQAGQQLASAMPAPATFDDGGDRPR